MEPFDLARWFVETFFGVPFDPVVHRRYLGEARAILRRGLDPEEVKSALKIIKSEDTRTIRSLWDVRLRDRTGRQYIDRVRSVPDPPPVFEADAYDHWFRTHGPRAAKVRPDLAVYRGWDGVYRTPEAGPITFAELCLLVGPELARKALAEYRGGRP